MLLMYIHDFFRSLTLLQSSYQFIDEGFFIDKDYVQEIDCLQLTENNLDYQKGNHNLIYINQKHPEKYEMYCLDNLYQYITINIKNYYIYNCNNRYNKYN